MIGRRDSGCGVWATVACCGVHLGGGCFGGVSDPDLTCMGVVEGGSFQGGDCSRKAKSWAVGQVAEGMVAAVDAEEVALARAFQMRAPRLPCCASWTDMAAGVTV